MRVLLLIFFALVGLRADVVDDKVQNLLNTQAYAKNRAFINAILTPKSSFVKSDGSADSIKILKALKENGILKLFFSQPRELTLIFNTNSNPNFFIKVMSDALSNIGYYKYITKYSSFDGENFIWKIVLTSEYVSDPVLLNEELKKSSSNIVEVTRESDTNWSYTIDMKNASLNVLRVSEEGELKLKRQTQGEWLDVRGLSGVNIISSAQNSWYPYVSFYDKALNLVRVQKEEDKRGSYAIDVDDSVAYIKISDSYSLKNIKDGLLVKAVR